MNNSVVNVKQFGAKGDATTDDRLAIQQAIDTIEEGGCLYFPPGVYRVLATTDTGNSVIEIETGTPADAPDFVILKLLKKKNLLITGHGATLLNDRGYVFFGLLCENVTIRGLRIENIANPLGSSFVASSAGWEPAAILMNYSAWCRVEDCFVSGQYRAIDFRRTTGCTIRGNSVFNNVYIAIATYGTLYQPGGWTQKPLPEFFSNLSTYFDDSGVTIENNLVSSFLLGGIYTDGPGSVVNNRVEHPVDAATTAFKLPPGAAIIVAAGQTLVAQNRLYAVNHPSFLSGDNTFTGIRVHFEDQKDGAAVKQVQILSNVIEGGCYGITLSECEDVMVKANDLRGYTGAAIHLFSADSEAFKLRIQSVHITENLIGSVDKASTFLGKSRAAVGGIVLAREGARVPADYIYVRNNIFNRRYDAIADAQARERHQYEIDLPLDKGSFSATLPNEFAGPRGQIRTINNSVFAGRNVDGYTFVVTEDTALPNLPGITEILVHVTGSQGNLSIKLPEHMTLGQKITVVNTDSFEVRVTKFGDGYTVNGTNSIRLNNTGATAANKAHSAIALVCSSDSISSNAYATTLIHATELYGGVVQY